MTTVSTLPAGLSYPLFVETPFISMEFENSQSHLKKVLCNQRSLTVSKAMSNMHELFSVRLWQYGFRQTEFV